MQAVFAKNLSEYDFLGDDERNKLDLTTETRRDVAFMIVNRKKKPRAGGFGRCGTQW
jgi:hypothetical protein